MKKGTKQKITSCSVLFEIKPVNKGLLRALMLEKVSIEGISTLFYSMEGNVFLFTKIIQGHHKAQKEQIRCC